MKDTELETILVKFANRVLDTRNGKYNPTLGELVDGPKQAILSHYIAKSEVEEIIKECKPKKAFTGFNGSYKSGVDQYEDNLRQRLKLRGGK